MRHINLTWRRLIVWKYMLTAENEIGSNLPQPVQSMAFIQAAL